MTNESTTLTQNEAMLDTPRSQRFEPTDLPSLWKYANMVVQSHLCPRSIDRPEDAVLVIQYGAELGLTVQQALQNINVIRGKVTLSADLMKALIMDSEVCEYFYRTESDDTKATYETKRVNHPEPISFTYTIEMARDAGLTKKDIWKSHGPRMLQHRSASTLGRDVYPDLLAGVYTPGEIQYGDPIEINAAQDAEDNIEPSGGAVHKMNERFASKDEDSEPEPSEDQSTEPDETPEPGPSEDQSDEPEESEKSFQYDEEGAGYDEGELDSAQKTGDVEKEAPDVVEPEADFGKEEDKAAKITGEEATKRVFQTLQSDLDINPERTKQVMNWLAYHSEEVTAWPKLGEESQIDIAFKLEESSTAQVVRRRLETILGKLWEPVFGMEDFEDLDKSADSMIRKAGRYHKFLERLD